MSKNVSNNSFVLEVLISTMHRTSLSFIETMFPHHKLENLNLLIINQTKKGFECVSDYDNIRVVNSYEIGLSKSRNLALKHAKGDICLISDDDVEYIKDFQSVIRNTYNRLTGASVITFKIATFTNEVYKIYPKESKQLLSRKDIKPTSSVEISFIREDIIISNISFNTLFGLGSYFTSGEEYLFLKNVLNNKLAVYFENEFIVKHALERSTSNMGSDAYVSALAAINYIDFKILSYFILIKYIVHLMSNNMIDKKDALTKFRVGVSAINKYRKLSK